MKTKYKIEKGQIKVEGNIYNSYSVLCYFEGKLLSKIADAFATEEQAKYFVDLCNRHNLEPVHLQNVLEDYL